MKSNGFNVYIIENKVNDKLYVGQTTYSVKQRFANHKCSAKKIKSALYGAFKKYGVDSFRVGKVISLNSKEEMDELEIFLISELNTIYPNGYNMTNGGEGALGRNVSDETKEKISQATKGKTNGCNNHFFGKKHSDETKNKISVRRKELKLKISDENKKKTSEYFSKKVINLITGEVYESVKVFSSKLNLNYDVCKKRLQGRYSKPDWFKYCYLDEYKAGYK